MGRLHDEIAKAGYELRESHSYRSIGDTDVRFLSVWRDGEKLGELDMTDRPVSFASVLSTTCLDIVSDYYDLDDEQDCILRRGYGRRTAAYLDAASTGIGLLSITENDRPAKGERNGEEPAGAGMAAIIESDNTWTAQIEHAGIEECGYTKLEFDHRPSDRDISTALAIKFASDLFSRRSDHCGDVHWLDADGGIADKIASFIAATEV